MSLFTLNKNLLFVFLLLFSFLINQQNAVAQKKKKAKSETNTGSEDKNAPKKIKDIVKSSKKLTACFLFIKTQ